MANADLDRIKSELTNLKQAIDAVAGRRATKGHKPDEVPTEREAAGLADVREVIERDLKRLDGLYDRGDAEIRSFALRVSYSSKLFDENGVEVHRFPVIHDAWFELSKTAHRIYRGS